MKFDSRTTAEFVGIFAVVISVLFLGYELRQSNRIAIGNAELEMSALNIELNSLIGGTDENAALLVKLRDPNSTLSEVETAKAVFYSGSLHTMWSANIRLYENGLISEERYNNFTFDAVSGTIAALPRLAPIFLFRFENIAASQSPEEARLASFIVEESKRVMGDI